MNIGRCWNDTQRHELDAIAKDGCAVLKVLERDEPRTPEWAYTVGLQHSYGHSEVLIIGFENEHTQILLHNINSRIRNKGLSFRHGSSAEEVPDLADAGARAAGGQGDRARSRSRFPSGMTSKRLLDEKQGVIANYAWEIITPVGFVSLLAGL